MNVVEACLLARLPTADDFRQALPDSSIIASARRGDRSALDELVRRHQNRIYNLAYRMLRQREDAEDVTQEAFLKAFEALPRLRHDAAFRSWLSRIAANLCLMRLRSRPEPTAVATDVETPSGDTGRDERWSGREIAVSIRDAIALLPPKYRLAVVAFYVEGRSYEEGARLAGVPRLTFKTWLYRARRMLRDALAAEKEAEP